MKIFIVTSGTYSEYQIDGVFSKKEYAEAAIRLNLMKCRYDQEIEEYEIDDYAGIQSLRNGFLLLMDYDGLVLKIDKMLVVNSENKNFTIHSSGKYFAYALQTDDKTKAIKSANERRAQLIASNEWVISSKDIQL